MTGILRQLFTFLVHLGPFGPLILGVLDSSFLFLPFGNDLLLIISIARDHGRFPLYVLMATLGSTGGVLLLDIVSRKGGEEGLKRIIDAKRFNYLRKQLSERAVPAVIVACLAPPPFPFTAVIAAASAFQYPQPRLLEVVFFARLVRYSLIGLAAIGFGRRIVRIAGSREFVWFMAGFIILCLIGSVLSIIRWTRR